MISIDLLRYLLGHAKGELAVSRSHVSDMFNVSVLVGKQLGLIQRRKKIKGLLLYRPVIRMLMEVNNTV